MTTPFRTKISLVILGLFLFFVLLEASLRLGGFIILSFQEYRNLQSIKHKGTYRIMCLGESTTQGQYPRFLEEILNQRNIGIRFGAIDKGVSGTNSSVIVSQLASNLARYRPDIVVAMMGSNDQGILYYKDIPAAKTPLLYYSKAYRLIRILWARLLFAPRRTTAPQEARAPGHQAGQASGDYRQLRQDEDSLKEAIAKAPQDSRAYVALGQMYRDQGRLPEAEGAFRKAVERNPKNIRIYSELWGLYRSHGQRPQLEDSCKQAIALNPRDYRAYAALSVLYEETGRPALAREYAQKANSIRSQYCVPLTVTNYRALKEALDKQGIRLVCVQYPMRDIGPLKRVFQDNQKGIVFVDNERLFKDAVKKDGYNTYFKDMFGGDFGHCTDKGNKLLAENIANAIVKEIFHR